MIKPRLQNSWTRRRKTLVEYQNEEALGAGLSLDVLFRAFAGIKNIVWFSVVYGEYDDDFCAIGLENGQAPAGIRERHPHRGPLGEAAAQDLNEYLLSPRVLEFLGFKSIEEAIHSGWEGKAKFALYVHDDCFFRLRPVDDQRIWLLTRLVLDVHSYYLGQEVDWSEVEQDCVKFLVQHKAISVVTDVRKQRVRLAPSSREVSIASLLKEKLSPVALTIQVQLNRAFVVSGS
jgi:hypothetical protein